MENKTITKPLNKTYLIENENQKEPSSQKRSLSSHRSTSKNRTKSKIKSSPGKMKQSENYKNITESNPHPWIGWRPKTLYLSTTTSPQTKHDSQNISSTRNRMGPKQSYKTNKIIQRNSKYQSSKPAEIITKKNTNSKQTSSSKT